MNNKESVHYIIKKLSINTTIITGVIIGGFILNRGELNYSRDYLKMSGLITCNIISSTYLVKNYKHIRKNTKKS